MKGPWRNTPENFWSYVDKSGKCWVWRGNVEKTGYGRVRWNIKQYSAHVISWMLFHGRFPQENLTIDHLCRNPLCVNPEHLEEVSMAVNILRGTSPAALNARKTHCKRGHKLSGINIYWRHKPRGGVERECKKCQRLFQGKGAPYLGRATEFKDCLPPGVLP